MISISIFNRTRWNEIDKWNRYYVLQLWSAGKLTLCNGVVANGNKTEATRQLLIIHTYIDYEYFILHKLLWIIGSTFHLQYAHGNTYLSRPISIFDNYFKQYAYIWIKQQRWMAAYIHFSSCKFISLTLDFTFAVCFSSHLNSLPCFFHVSSHFLSLSQSLARLLFQSLFIR